MSIVHLLLFTAPQKQIRFTYPSTCSFTAVSCYGWEDAICMSVVPDLLWCSSGWTQLFQTFVFSATGFHTLPPTRLHHIDTPLVWDEHLFWRLSPDDMRLPPDASVSEASNFRSVHAFCLGCDDVLNGAHLTDNFTFSESRQDMSNIRSYIVIFVPAYVTLPWPRFTAIRHSFDAVVRIIQRRINSGEDSVYTGTWARPKRFCGFYPGSHMRIVTYVHLRCCALAQRLGLCYDLTLFYTPLQPLQALSDRKATPHI